MRQALQDRPVPLALKAPPDQLVPPGLKVHKATQVRQVQLEQPAPQDLKVLKATKALPATQALPVPQALQAQPALPALPVQLEQLPQSQSAPSTPEQLARTSL